MEYEEKQPGYDFVFKGEQTFSEKELAEFRWLKNETRRYRVEKKIGNGQKGIAYECVPLDDGVPIPEIPVVVKEPNTSHDSKYDTRESRARLHEINDQAYAEWQHVRKRLEECPYANHIFDLDYVGPMGEDGPRVITVQRLIRNGEKLDEWVAPVQKHRQKPPPFSGLKSWEDWQRHALIIARAVEDFHGRRVTHGDLHPGNIFLSEAKNPYVGEPVECDPYAILIDYGEAFLEPSDDERRQGTHAYRAPERDTPLYIPTQYVDVYSYGRVLYFLATGEGPEVEEDGVFGQAFHGHARREGIRARLDAINPVLLRANPAVLDIIFSCTAYDPSARPSMSRVVRWLSSGNASDRPEMSFSDVASRLGRLVEPFSKAFAVDGELPTLQPDDQQAVFLRLIDSKIDELESILTCPRDQIQIGGTRDDLIDHLQTLLGQLGPGDSWTALTTPDVWQNRALGLDGRYATATVAAIRRKASVRRFFVICAEEMGKEYSQSLADALTISTSGTLRIFGEKIAECCKGADGVNPPKPKYCEDYRKRLRWVVESLDMMVRTHGLEKDLKEVPDRSLRKMEGLVLGFLPVETRKEVQAQRVRNPAMLMRFAHPTGHEKWLLVMTDMRGRIMGSEAMPEPHLLGLRVYKSVFEHTPPQNKILRYEDLAKKAVILNAADLNELAETMKKLSV